MKIILLIIIFTAQCFAYETQGKLENLSNITIIKEADAFSAKLTLWPYDATDEKSFYELEGKDFLDFFLVSRVSKVVRSENNNRAIEIYLTLVLKKYFLVGSFYIFNHRDINIPINIKGIQPERRELKIKDFVIQNETLDEISVYWPYYLGVGVILFVLSFLFLVQKRKKIKKPDEVFKPFSVNSRNELEEVYKQRKNVFISFPSLESQIKLFFDEIDKIQYKSNWNEHELNELITKYNKLFLSTGKNEDEVKREESH